MVWVSLRLIVRWRCSCLGYSSPLLSWQQQWHRTSLIALNAIHLAASCAVLLYQRLMLHVATASDQFVKKGLHFLFFVVDLCFTSKISSRSCFVLLSTGVLLIFNRLSLFAHELRHTFWLPYRPDQRQRCEALQTFVGFSLCSTVTFRNHIEPSHLHFYYSALSENLIITCL